MNLVWERTGELPEKLANAPELRASCKPLWDDFLELHGSRQSAGLGPARITWRDIADWQRFRGVTLESWEVDAIRAADNLWLSEFTDTKGDGEQ